MKIVRFLVAWLAAGALLLIRLTCRIRVHDDPRPALRRQGRRYVYAFLHAQQIATVMGAEPGTGAIVSRSPDGAMLIPSLRVRRVVPIRGSTRHKDKGEDKGKEKDRGGDTALTALIEHVRAGAPGYFAVDGPVGPRNRVRRGIARLAIEADAVILPAIALPKRRWILRNSWERFQIPKPFTRIDGFFGEPVQPTAAPSIEVLRELVEVRLTALEARHDPEEASRVSPLTSV